MTCGGCHRCRRSPHPIVAQRAESCTERRPHPPAPRESTISTTCGNARGCGDDLVREGLTCTGSGVERPSADVIAVKEDDGSWTLNTYRLRRSGVASLVAEETPSTVEHGLTAWSRRVQDRSLSRCGTGPKVASDGR